jgi:hypothetical protein
MAGSVEMGPEGGSAPAGGGLDELIRALARYSTGLERVAAKLGGGEAAPVSEAPTYRSVPKAERSKAFESVAEWFRDNAPKATRLASALAVQPRATARADAIPTRTPTPVKETPTPAPILPTESPAPLADAGGLLADLMRQLVEIAQGIARKMGVTAPASPKKEPETKPMPVPVEKPANLPKPAGKQPSRLAGMASSAGSGMASAAGAAVGGLTAGLGAALAAPVAFAEVVSGVASKITGFVAAINPGLVQTLGLAFRDLTAVVGVALQPTLQAVVPIIKQFTNALYPLAKTIGKVLSEVFEALQPAIDAITDIFFVMAETLQPVVQLIGDTLKFLAPVFSLLANIVKQVYIAFGAMVAAVVGVIRGLFGAVNGNGFKDAMQGLQDGLKLLTAALIKGLGYMLKFFGFVAGLNGMINFLKGMNKPKENAQGIAAAQNAQFSSIEQLGKSAALASVIATATPGGAKENKTDQDFFAGMIEELEGIKDNGPDLISAIDALPGKIGEYLAKLPPKIGKYVADAINNTGDAVGKAAYQANPLKVPGEALGDLAAWMIYGSPK